MRKALIATLFVALSASALGQTASQIVLQGNFGNTGNRAILGGKTLQIPTDADYTMTPADWSEKTLTAFCTATLTTGHSVIGPGNSAGDNYGQDFNFGNRCTQPLTIKAATGTGVTIQPGYQNHVWFDGTNYVTGAAAAAQLPAVTGDVAIPAGGNTATLAVVNTAPGVCGDGTHVCVVTTDGKGRVTSQSSVLFSGTTYTGSGAISISGSTISIPNATDSVTGAMTAADHATFTTNSGLAAGALQKSGGAMSGALSGTTGAFSGGISALTLTLTDTSKNTYQSYVQAAGGVDVIPAAQAGVSAAYIANGVLTGRNGLNPPVPFASIFGASGTNHSSGAVPDPGATGGATRFLNENGSFLVPPTAVGVASTVIGDNAGLIGDGVTNFDGSTGFPGIGSSQRSATPSAPAFVSTSANEQILQVLNTVVLSFTPGTTSAVTRLAGAPGSGYALSLFDQTAASAGTTPALAGTMSGVGSWNSLSLGLIPTAGNTVSFIGVGSTVQGSGTTSVVTLPSGIVSGDYLIACSATLTAQTAILASNATPPAAFNIPLGNYTDYAAHQLLCSAKVATGSEPTTYTWTFPSSSKSAVFIADYHNVGSIQTPALNQLYSPLGTFSVADVAKPVCVFSPTALTESCGTITGYLSPGSITTSFTASAANGNQWYTYGTDNFAAMNTILASTPCQKGCDITLASKSYVFSNGFVLPPNQLVQLVGAGSAVPYTTHFLLASNVPPQTRAGTQLNFETQSMTVPAVTVGGVNTNIATTTAYAIRDLTLYGGVGYGMDGGGNDGLAIINALNVTALNVMSFNFTGRGAYVDGLNSAGFTQAVRIENPYFAFNGVGNFQLGSANNAEDIEATSIQGGTMESSGGPNIILAGSNVQAFEMHGTTIQWANRNAVGPEIQFTSTFAGAGCLISENYIEVSNHLGSLSNVVTTPVSGSIGCRLRNNHISGSPTHIVFSLAGVPLPAATTGYYNQHQEACVSDAPGNHQGDIYNITGNSVNGYTLNNTTPLAPNTFAFAPNSQVINVYADIGSTWLGQPAGTARTTLVGGSGSYSLRTLDSVAVSYGRVPPVQGQLAAAGRWLTTSFAMAPTAGNTIAFVSSATNYIPSGLTSTVTAPAGVATGNMLIACTINNNAITPPTGFSAVYSQTDSANVLRCYSKVATASEPTSYVWTQAASAALNIAMLAYTNVASVGGTLPTGSTSTSVTSLLNFWTQTGPKDCL